MKIYRLFHRWFFLNLFLALLIFNSNTQANELQKALRASYAAEREGKYDEALKNLLEVLMRDSRNYFLQLRAGYLNMMLGQYNSALDAYETAADLERRAVEPAIGALKTAILLGNWTVAEKWAFDILKKDPNNYVGLSRLAYSYFARKNYAKAAEQYEKVIELYPSDTDMKKGLAWSLYYMGNKPKARALFTDVLAISPDDSSAKEGLTLLYK